MEDLQKGSIQAVMRSSTVQGEGEKKEIERMIQGGREGGIY
jgi:hypothetical protein